MHVETLGLLLMLFGVGLVLVVVLGPANSLLVLPALAVVEVGRLLFVGDDAEGADQ